MRANTDIGDVIGTPNVLKAFSGQAVIKAHQGPHHITLLFPKVADPSTWEDVLDRFETLGSDVLKMPEGNGIQMSRTTYGRFFGQKQSAYPTPLFKEYPTLKHVTAEERQAITELTGNPVIAVMKAANNYNAIALSGSIDNAKKLLQRSVSISVFEAFDQACQRKGLSNDDKQNLILTIRDMRNMTDPEMADDAVRAVSKQHGRDIADALLDAAHETINPTKVISRHRPTRDMGILQIPGEKYDMLFKARLI